MATGRDRRLAVWTLLLLGALARPAAASEGGLVLVPDPAKLLLLVAAFALLVPMVSRLLLTPILNSLEQRAERTDGARRRAARLDEEARALLDRYEGSLQQVRAAAESDRRELLESSRRDAAARLAEARAQAEGELGRVREEIAASVGSARDGLRDQARELAREAAARVLGRSVA